MATYTKFDYADRVEYYLADESLPAGCTHSGVNRAVIYKDDPTGNPGGVRVGQRICACLKEANSYDILIATVETGNTIIVG